MSKRLLSILLTLSLLLTAVPVFAATYTDYVPTILPDTGMDITIGSTGADGNQIKLVLTAESQTALNLDPQTVSTTVLEGAYLTGDFYYTPTTYVTFTDGTWADTSKSSNKVVDKFIAEQLEPVEGDAVLYDQPIPISGTYYDAEGNVIETCTIEKKQVAASTHPVNIEIIKTVANQAKTAVCINISRDDLQAAVNDPTLPLGVQFGNGAWSVQNIKLYPSETIVDTGVFSSNTAFISSSTIVNNPNGWTKDGSDNYLFYRKGAASGDGPFAIVSPKVSGTYDVYCLMKEKNDAEQRTIALNIGDSGKFVFKKNNADSVHSWYWEKENTGKTITLTEGKSILIQLSSSSGGFGRYAGIALVPTSENFEFADAASAHSNILNLATFEYVQNLTFDVEDIVYGENISVTVDGTSYSVAPGTAVSKGVSMPTFHKHGEFIANATVWDALAAAGITAINDKAIYLNDKVCHSPQYTYLTAGDKITTTATVDITNFSRIKLTDIHQTDGSATAGGIKMCLNYANVGSKLGSWAQVSEALVGVYFTGYFETLSAAVTGLGVTAAGDKIYFESLEVESQQAHSTSRIDLQLDNRTNPNEAKNVVKTLPDGITKVHAPYAYVCGKKNSWYTYDNIYMVNSSTPVGVTTVKLADGKYAIDTEGDKLIYIVTITYDTDGKTILSTNVKDEYITFDKSAIVNVADNQKVLVWGRRAFNNQPALDGTTMIPLCAPITK